MIEPSDLEILSAALVKLGWVKGVGKPEVYDTWADPDGRGSELLLPLDPRRGDYSHLLHRAVAEFTHRAGRHADHALTTARLALRSGFEEVEWHKESPYEGLIAWEAGRALYDSARQQLMASAKAAHERRRYHGQASSYLAQRFIGEALMGQTDVGSFIISAYAPTAQQFHLSAAGEEAALSATGKRSIPTVSGKSILDTFESSLLAMRDGIDEYREDESLDVFLAAVDEGISVEFARALSTFVAAGDAEVRVVRRDAGGHTRRTDVGFSGADAEVISRVATALEQESEPIHAVVRGEVTNLSKSASAVGEGARDRVIRLRVYGGTSASAVRVRLSADQYDLAVEAHRSDRFLIVTGLLAREAKLTWMYSPSAVSMGEQLPEARPQEDFPMLWDDQPG